MVSLSRIDKGIVNTSPSHNDISAIFTPVGVVCHQMSGFFGDGNSKTV